MRPPEQFSVPAAADCKIAKPTSSLRFAVPAGDGANHLSGYVLGGQRHAQRCGPAPVSTPFTARWYTYRHPNCDWQDVMMQFGSDRAKEESPSIMVQAGTGEAVSFALPWSSADRSWYLARAGFSTADSDYTEVVVKVVDVTLRGLFSWDVARQSLSTGDDRVEHLDTTYPAVGLMVDKAIASSANAGPPGVVQQISEAWDNYHPQIMSWWVASSSPKTVASDTLTDFFGGASFTHRCRAKTSTTSTTDTRWYLYTWCTAGTTYTCTVSTSVESASLTGLTNTTPGWQAAITGVAMKNNTDDTFTIKAKRTAGAGTIYCAAVSGLEE